MNGSGSNPTPSGSQTWALSVQNTLRRYGPMDFATLVYRTGLDEYAVRQGLRASRRSVSNAHFANEIVCTAKLNGSYVYFLGNRQESKDYDLQRRAIALGHINSVIRIEEKRLAKFPDPQRQAAINMLTMAGQLLTTAPA